MKKAVFLAGLCALGCSTKRTEVVIGVATDLSAPGALDQVKLEIFRDGVIFADLPPWDIPGGAGDKFVLPASFGVYSDDGSEPRIDVQIHGLKNGNPIVTRRAIFALVKEQTLFLRMALVQRCASKGDCPNQTETCVEGKCRPAAVDSRSFPVYTAKAEEIFTCSSGTNFINTHSGMTIMPTGGCQADEYCEEGTCYKQLPGGGPDGGGLPTQMGWQQVPTTSPPPRKFESATQMVGTDSGIKMWGGLDDLNQPVADTWAFDGNSWTQLASDIGHAGADPTGPTVFDKAHGEVFTFREPSSEVIVFDGTSWITRSTGGAGTPEPRTHSRAAFDEAHNQVVLFGGTCSSTGQPCTDTWLWDGTSWTPATPATSPPGRHDGGMEWDAAHNRVVLFGGKSGTTQLQDTWAWDGSNWSPVATTFPNSVIFTSGGMLVYDSTKSRLLWLNGTRETYVLMGSAWQQLYVDANAPLLGPYSAAYLNSAATIIAFGGTDPRGMALAQTWVLNLP